MMPMALAAVRRDVLKYATRSMTDGPSSTQIDAHCRICIVGPVASLAACKSDSGAGPPLARGVHHHDL